MSIYESYQQTNIDWLPSIPSTWKAKRIKNLFSLRDERSYKPLSEVNLISLYTSLGVRQHSDIEHTTGNKARNADGYKIVNVDDIIVNIMLCWMGAIGRSAYSGVTSPAYDIYKPHEGVNSSYYHYLFRTPIFSQQCFRNGHGIMMMRWRTYSPEFTSIVVPVPPREEQDQIVRFLDWKISEINRLINIKRKEIERLEELKNHTITKCITKGLDNTVQFKYSGTDWIGEIPEHWVTIQLRRTFSVILGKMLAPAPSSDSDTHEEYICAKDVHFDGVDLTSLKKMWFSPSEKKQYEIKSGDLLIVEGGAGAGNAALVPDLNGQSIYVQNSIHIVRAKSDQALNKFLCYWIGSLVKRGYMKNICSVATIPHFTKDKVLSTVMPLAPIEEQIEIVAFLDKKCQEIDGLISFKEQQTQALHEFKTRLISDVVTGKIDVRGIEIPEYEYTAEEADTDSEAEAEEFDEQEEV